MILKALYDYYDRMGKRLPMRGLEEKEISFIIVIDNDGNFKRIENRMDGKNSQKFLVAKSVKRSSSPIANLLWDNFSYVMGVSKETYAIDIEQDDAKKRELQKGIDKNKKNHKTFIESIQSLKSKLLENRDLLAINRFYERYENCLHTLLIDDTEKNQILKNITKNVSFMIEGDIEIVAEKREILDVLLNTEDNNDNKSKTQHCLVTGKEGEIARLFSSTSIPGSQATASIISFQKNMGFDSYGKEQCYNAPVSDEAEFKITTALNYLLRKDSKNKFLIGNRTFVFWASSDSEAAQQAEEGLFSLLGYANDDDPNRRIQLVRDAFNAIYSGKLVGSLDDKFYFLGLAPNAGRIAVVYWSESTLQNFAGRILKHFSDMEIVDTRKDRKPYFGLHQMMANVTLGGKSSDVQPNLPEATIKSIVQGSPYPYALYSACIRRVRAEQELYIGRAAIIKAYLNRQNNNDKELLKVMLDKENKNQGYLCGRLFATLEYLQERSNGISTIRSRYMNAASATPAAVFPTLLNLSVHHEEKLDKGGQIYMENMKTEIIEKLSANGFPSHLDLNDQGRFMIGYYHQRQDFYTSKKDKEDRENNVEQSK